MVNKNIANIQKPKEMVLNTREEILFFCAQNKYQKVATIARELKNATKVSYHGIRKEIQKLIQEGKLEIINGKISTTKEYEGFIQTQAQDIKKEMFEIKDQIINAHNLLEVDSIISEVLSRKKFSKCICYTHNIWWPFLHLSEQYFTSKAISPSYTIYSKNTSKLDIWASEFETLAQHTVFFVNKEFPWDIFLFKDIVILIEFEFAILEKLFNKCQNVQDLMKLKFKELLQKPRKIHVEVITEEKKILFYKKLIENCKKYFLKEVTNT